MDIIIVHGLNLSTFHCSPWTGDGKSCTIHKPVFLTGDAVHNKYEVPDTIAINQRLWLEGVKLTHSENANNIRLWRYGRLST